MKISIIVSIVIAVLTIGGVLFFLKKENTPLNPTTLNKETDLPLPSNTQSRYIEYSDGVLENNLDNNRILFFYANWCPTCRPVNKEISENSDRIPEGFVVIRTNYNDDETDKNEEQLANKYNVSYQHTFVELDKNNDVIQIWNGGDFTTLLSKIKR